MLNCFRISAGHTAHRTRSCPVEHSQPKTNCMKQQGVHVPNLRHGGKLMSHSSTFNRVQCYHHLTNLFTNAHLLNLCQSGIVLQEEGEVLVGDIQGRVPPQSPVLLLRVPTTRESILHNLPKEREREQL